MYFEINVSLNGFHLFATHERSINNINELKEVYKVFKEKFLESDGFKLTITKQVKQSEEININNL
jgi:hypothetical protein